jgi:UPF0755 protein
MELKSRRRVRRRRAPRSVKVASKRRRWLWVAGAVFLGWCVALAGALFALWRWSGEGRAASGYLAVEFDDPATASVVAKLANQGLVTHTGLAWATKELLFPGSSFVPGEHWLPRSASLRELFMLLTRQKSRAHAKVTFPEGWDSFQMAERLAAAGVCSRDAFLERVHPSATSAPNADAAPLEGYLYPATYDFLVNTSASDVGERLRQEAEQRFDAVLEANAERARQLETELGLSEVQLVTLASIVQKEAADDAEYGLIASVFLNRLGDPDFRPKRTLQSDPTAAYGCKVHPELASCQLAAGRVTRDILRDAANPYNTYKNPGLPPGPIGNPSSDVLAAVLTAPKTEFLFFFAPRGARHRFSRSLVEHNAAIARSSSTAEPDAASPH